MRRPAMWARRAAEQRRQQERISALEEELAAYRRGWPPGHFYSPIPSLEEVEQRADRIWGSPPATLPELDLDLSGQLALLDELARYHDEHPFPEESVPERRFYLDNPNFRHGEAIVLYCLLRHLRPRRVVEIGSGHSSCALLDTNDAAFGGAVSCTFVEPYPQLLRSLLRPEDLDAVEVVERPLQDVDESLFARLEPGDVVLVDSTHVSKVDSDVNHLLFRILPALRPGVYVHFHDVYYPFEYPPDWVYGGRAWNEAYLLRAFLQDNTRYRIAFFSSCLAALQPHRLAERLPLMAKGAGSSLWLRKSS